MPWQFYFIFVILLLNVSVFGTSDGNREKEYRKFIGERELPVPFKTKVTEPLKTGHTIHVIGTISEKPKRIDFNFHKGASDDADMPLHLSIRFDEGLFHSKIVYNIYENGNWSETEQRIANPFKANSEFDLRVRITDGEFKMYANRKEIGIFKQRTSIDGIDHVSIKGDLKSLSLFKYGGILFETPYTALANLTPGKRLDISAMPRGKRVDIDLLRKNGDIALQLSIRYGESAIVRNTRVGELWGEEDRTGKFPLNKNELFDLTIINESWSFQIFINGKRFGTFAHRGDVNDVKNLEITGDVDILTVTINDRALGKAIIWIQNLLYVRIMEESFIITKKDYFNCIENKNISINYLISTLYKSEYETYKNFIKFNDTINLSHLNINFGILLEVNEGRCSSKSLEFAFAKVCHSEKLKKYSRPIIGKLVICKDSPSWKHIKVPEDVIKHEIMHALGFGIYINKKKEKTNFDIIQWKVGNNYDNNQTFIRYFMDFDSKAVKFAQKHFNCTRLKRIEADDKNQFHLNEYIFGNELMTPISSNSKNILTEISASIMEETYLGNISWYKFDMNKVAKESKKYWYGKDWGCDFIEKSCYEYIQNNINKPFPFCSEKDYMISYWKSGYVEVCYEKRNKQKNKMLLKCNIQSYIDEPGIKINIKKTPIINFYPNLQHYGIKSNAFGSTKIYRYCPMIKQIAENNEFFLRIDKEGSKITKC
uniref:Leishmanolysin-like peptidase n=1 Tax=Strongyloides stercoralis TaxID=6248 RepID=A0AAF5DH14_STRER